MQKDDTVRLLRECDSGAKMGVQGIEDVLKHVKGETLRKTLAENKTAFTELAGSVQKELARFGDEGKSPNPVVQAMSWIKTGVALTADDSDAKAAEMITDGCNMGIKSLNGFLNDYPDAEKEARDVCKKLIGLQAKLTAEMREYL